MNSAIKNMVETCAVCAELLPTKQKEVIKEKSSASAPMTHVGVDLFDFMGQDWLVMVDRYSGFPFAKRLTRTATSDVTKILLEWFLEWGYPSVIRSDGGPQFRAKFVDFCKENNITHELSSPYNPRSNGLAESAVKNMKHLLKKCHADKSCFRSALLEWRNVPRADGISPAMLFLNRRQKTKLPMPQVQGGFSASDLEAARKNSLLKERKSHDKSAINFSTFKIGSCVRIQDAHTKKWDTTGRITDISGSGGSYYIFVPSSGKTIRRNSHFLRPAVLLPALSNKDKELLPSPADNKGETKEQGHSPPASPSILRRSPRLQRQNKSVHFG